MLAAIHWDIDPEIFSLGPISVRWYGLLFAIGFILSYQVLKKIFLDEGKEEKLLEKLTIYVILGTLLGARMGHCFFYDHEFRPWVVFLPFSYDPFEFTGFQGLASHGGAAGILIAVFLYCRKYKFNYFWLVDRLVIVVALTGSLIRLGNLMNSEIVGNITTVPWAFKFMRNYEDCNLAGGCLWADIPARHPAQLYESISSFIIFLGLVLLFKKTSIKEVPGKLFSLFMVVLFSLRFFYEFLKENQSGFEEGMALNMGQILSLPLIAVGIILFFYSEKLKNQGTGS